MAVQVPSSSIGTGVRVTVGEGDTIIVRESYDIISTDSEAISGLITSATLEIAGYVFGEDAGIDLRANTETGSFHTVRVAQTGSAIGETNPGIILVGGQSGSGQAVIENAGTVSSYLDMALTAQRYGDIVITNSGSISSNSSDFSIGYAVYALANDVQITNSGTIVRTSDVPSATYGDGAVGGRVSPGFGRDVGAYFYLYNSGEIISPLSAVSTENGIDEIINTGTMVGGLNIGWGEVLSGWDDYVENTGSIHGDIGLGAGDDTVLGQTGFIEGTIDAGAGDDLIKSGTGDDMIIGGAGADDIWGGAGVDTASYEGFADGVRVSLNAGRGWYGHAQGDELHEIENLIGSDRQDTLIGNSAANMLEGGNADDILSAFGGDDTLFGGNGEDNILGGNGNDYISGDRHQDRLTGGAGEDIFAFLNILDSGPANTERDNITDFTQGQDLIDLTELGDLFFGGTAFSGSAGEIIYYHVAGGTRTVVEIDTDGDSVADFGILLSNAAHTMTAADFLFV